MKITKKHLQKLIKEEVKNIYINEIFGGSSVGGYSPGMGGGSAVRAQARRAQIRAGAQAIAGAAKPGTPMWKLKKFIVGAAKKIPGVAFIAGTMGFMAMLDKAGDLNLNGWDLVGHILHPDTGILRALGITDAAEFLASIAPMGTPLYKDDAGQQSGGHGMMGGMYESNKSSESQMLTESKQKYHAQNTCETEKSKSTLILEQHRKNREAHPVTKKEWWHNA